MSKGEPTDQVCLKSRHKDLPIVIRGINMAVGVRVHPSEDHSNRRLLKQESLDHPLCHR